MTETSASPFVLLWVLGALQLFLLFLLWRQAQRSRAADEAARLQQAAQDAQQRQREQELADARRATERESDRAAAERVLRDLLQAQSQERRVELDRLQQGLQAQAGESMRLQQEQLDAFRLQLTAVQQGLSSGLQQQSEHQSGALQRLSDAVHQQLATLGTTNEQRLADMRRLIESRLATLQEGNERKLEQMRLTVDEKLHATLEQRLGESFRQVAERLDQVHRGLGDMQALARDVGSLNRVLSNVKTRGIVGEVQLGALLEQVLTVEQYAANVEVVPGSGARVEFAIRLPGGGPAGGAGGAALWLPIDAKFPREDYERLLDAQDRSDAAGVETAGRALEQRIRQEARTIREKYIAAPHTTDFAILFLPTEGLYAEVLRRPGLIQALQGEHRITLAGPTTLLAMLNSLQMGFRTLALERRSAEVWEVLGAVKTEFGKFGDVLAKTRKKLEEATSTIDAAQTRTRVMTRRLTAVEAMPEPAAARLLGAEVDAVAHLADELPGASANGDGTA